MARLRSKTTWILGPILLSLVGFTKADPGSLRPEGAGVWHALSVSRQPQGLPQDAVLAIVQSKDGYIWVGTRGGLARFDGARFTTFDDRHQNQPGESEIWALTEGDDSSLWIGAYGTGLTRFKNGQFTSYTTKEGLVHNFVTALCKGRDGSIWIGTDGGLTRFKDERFDSYTIKDGLIENAITSLHADQEGNVWIGTKSGGLNWIRDGEIHKYDFGGLRPSSPISAIWHDHHGALWLATANGLFRLQDGKSARYTMRDGLLSSKLRSLHEDSQGNLWIGTSKGLNRYKDGEFSVPDTGDAALSTAIVAIEGDRDGNLWVGSADRGLACLRQGQFVTYTVKDGLIENEVSTVLEDVEGNLWIGTARGLAVLRNRTFADFSIQDGIPNNFVVSLAQDGSRRLWVGTEVGLYRSRAAIDCAHACAPKFDKVGSLYARTILPASSGDVWIGTDLNGLVRYTNKTSITYTTQDGLGSNAIRSLTRDQQGNLWIGTREGLSRYQDGKFLTYGAKDGLVDDIVQALYLDPDNSLWIAARGGLSRFKDGHFTTYTLKDGLYCSVLYSVVEDSRHNLWIGCNKGIFYVPKSQLNDFAEGRIHSLSSAVYGLEDGLSSTVISGGSSPGAFRTRDGRLWFPTTKGLSVIDPKKLSVSAVPPSVHIEEVSIDRDSFDLSKTAKAPPGRGDLVFRYTALNFQAPARVRFKYRLEGYDSDWIDAGSRRIAQYTNTPPGWYTFRVVATNDQSWSGEGESFRIYLAPHFYQMYWFFALCALSVAFAGLGAHLWRTRRLQQRKQELVQIVRERTMELRQHKEHLEEQVAKRTLELSEKTEQLLWSHRLLQGIIDSSSAVIYVKDVQGRYLLTNRRFAELFHVERGSVIGKTDYDLFPHERADAFRAFDQEVLSAGTVLESEELLPQDDGLHSYISIKSPLIDEKAQTYAICGISTDISERKRLEKQLFQAQKMEAIGRLAGGIAHDFNNLLTIINGSSELLRDVLTEPDARSMVESIHEAGTKAGSLTRQLLAFSRRQVLQPKILSLNEVLADLGKMLPRLVREDIEIKTITEPELALIRCDPSQIEQVVVNLVVNACDAMPNGGTLTLTTANTRLEDEHTGSHGLIRAGSYACLTVKDTGCGMDPETQVHIFEPFFTTKEGKGTGLGLATVYGIVQQAGGYVSVHSSPDCGATFRVYFPRVESNHVAKAVSVSDKRLHGSEKILVAEDQDGVRSVVCDILSRNGYTVIAARSGREALKLAEDQEVPFDLLITDVVMPQMGGRELAAVLAAQRPETAVLLMSGYTDRTCEDQEWAVDVAFIQKPFTVQTLLQKVREALDQRSARGRRKR